MPKPNLSRSFHVAGLCKNASKVAIRKFIITWRRCKVRISFQHGCAMSPVGRVTTSMTTTHITSNNLAIQVESSLKATKGTCSLTLTVFQKLVASIAQRRCDRHQHHPAQFHHRQRPHERRHTTSFQQFLPPRRAGRKALRRCDSCI